MTRIKIPFNTWSLERLLDGRKTATSRYKKYGRIGDMFIICNKIFRLVYVSRTKLNHIANVYFTEEGARSTKEFINIWTDIHKRRGFRPDDYVWFHMFEFVEELNEESK